jgi:NAD(P)-dependent dehydrogenase (short-subunit alcohol dehydrogenase family)
MAKSPNTYTSNENSERSIMDSLKDQVILVTGAGMGLGEAIARRAAKYGAKLAIVDFNFEAAKKVASDIPQSKAYKADVTVAADMERVCADIVKDFGKLDGAVNNAGVGELLPLLETSEEEWHRIIGVNLTGIFLSMKAELPYLLENGGGHIVNIASMAGVASELNMAAYTASKHGAVGLTKSVALDYGKQNIRCNAVCPSMVKTALNDDLPEEVWQHIEQSNPTGKLVTPEQVAASVVFLLTEDSAGMTGSVHLVDAGIFAH